MNDIRNRTSRWVPRPGRATLMTLSRRPLVRGILAATVIVQVGFAKASVGRADESAVEVQKVADLAMVAAPVEAAAIAAPQQAWLTKATDREAERLAAEYRSKGYQVSSQLAAQIAKAAAANGIDPKVAFGLVRAESSFRNTATSPVGAVGLTQLMPKTAAWMEPGVTRTQLRDPETNLRVGFKYLRYLMDRYNGDENLALLAYNRGPGTVDKALRRGRSPDNGYADFVKGKANHGHTLYSR